MWAALAILPVIAAAWFWGLRPALVAALLCSLLSGLLVTLAQPSQWKVIGQALLVSLAVYLPAGAVVGRLHDLGERLRDQISERKRAEEALREYQQGLEYLGEQRTQELAQRTDALERELTQRQRADEALAGERNMLRAVMENAPDRIYLKDTESRFITASAVSLRLFGVKTLEELVGKTDYDFFPREDADRYYADDQKVMRSGQPLMNSMGKRTHPDGQERWSLHSKVPLRDDSGSVVGLVGVSRDITERKRAEEALAAERNLLRNLIDNLPDYIFVKDAESRFITTNSAHFRTFNNVRSLDEVVGKTDFDLFPRELAERYYADERQVISSGEPLVDRQELALDQHGHEQWLLTTKVPLRDATGSVVGLMGIARDITERKRAEEQLQRYAAELERANQELRDFTYIVSHDLRAPLINLKGFAGELRHACVVVRDAMEVAWPHLGVAQRQAVTRALQEDVPEALGFIDASATRMDQFVRALLTLSRVGHRDLSLTPIDMNALVEETLRTLAHQIEEGQVRVTVAPLPQVVADRTSMEQIMGNLLSNAVQYLDRDRPGEIEISGERGQDETTFRVRDNGRGIAEEDMDKVFAPFRRAGRQDRPGEGMALAYVRALIRRHGGDIWCESALGVGTTFTFTISDHLEKGGDHE